MKGLVFALALLLPIAACTQSAPLEVNDVWTRASASGANAAVFMTIRSPTTDRLIAASTPLATRTDLMTMEGDSSAMAMVYIDAIDIPANTPVSLDPSGLHVWLAGLTQPLTAGQTFELELTFEKAGVRNVVVSIIAPAAPAPMTDMDM